MAEPLQRTIRVRCPVDHAFHVFTSRVDLWWPSGHRRFAVSQLTLAARVGGRFVERSDAGEEALLGEVMGCEPPHRIRYTWYPGAIEHPTLVDVCFEEDGEETVVKVIHTEGDSQLGDAWPSRVRLFERGWTHVLDALAEHIAGEHEGG